MTRLDPFQEALFKAWYRRVAEENGLDSDPDHPLHFYDWRGAYRAGARAGPDRHWPSEFKTLGHPNLILDGVDTRTGLRVTPELISLNEAINRHAKARS